MNIPDFINARAMTVTRTGSSFQKGEVRDLTAVDPEGDSFQLSKWTQDVGSTAMLPREELTVAYQQQGHPPLPTHEVGVDEAYDLYKVIKRSRREDNLDAQILGFLLADLASKGGIGGA